MKAYLLIFICCLMGTACAGTNPGPPALLPTLNSEAATAPPDATPTISLAAPAEVIVEPEPDNEAAAAEPIAADDIDEVDVALQAVNDSICAEIVEVHAELETRIENGEDVEELSAAIAELADEFESCGFQLESSE